MMFILNHGVVLLRMPLVYYLVMVFTKKLNNQVQFRANLEPRSPRRRMIRFKSNLAWIFSLSILALCIFGTYGDYNGHPLTRSDRIAYLTLSRIGWAIGLSIIITLCFDGQGGSVYFSISVYLIVFE